MNRTANFKVVMIKTLKTNRLRPDLTGIRTHNIKRFAVCLFEIPAVESLVAWQMGFIEELITI